MFDQASHHRLGVYIQAAAARVDNLHRFLLWSRRENLAQLKKLLCVLTLQVATVGGAGTGPLVTLKHGLMAPSFIDLLHTATRDRVPWSGPIFICGVNHGSWPLKR
jgi:hypothetical protein